MIIERRNYSEEILNDLIERAFCEGYEYAQKVFFDYSKYSEEEAAKIRELRNKIASMLKEERSLANNNLQQTTKLAKTHFTPMSSDSAEDAAKLISKRDSMIENALKKRNSSYDDALKRSEERKRQTMKEILGRRESKILSGNKKPQNSISANSGSFIKKSWNGENGLGKTGNRVLMIGVPTAAALISSMYLRKKSKEKEEERKKKNN